MTTTSFTDRGWLVPGAWCRVLLLALVMGCGGNDHSPSSQPSTQKGPPGADYWVERTDTELDLLIRSTCAASVADGKPILLQFSAAWCADCNLVRNMSGEPEVAAELERWHKVVVDVGRFDRHRTLMKAFDVAAIVHWVALQPTECEGSPARWPRLREGTLEPKTGTSGPRTPAQLVLWLQEARG